jgi:hypothetical protein
MEIIATNLEKKAKTHGSIEGGEIERKAVEEDGDVEAVALLPVFADSVLHAVRARNHEEEGDDDEAAAEETPK